MIKVKLSAETSESGEAKEVALEEAESKYKDGIEKFEKAVIEMGNKFILDNLLINVKVDQTNHAYEYDIVQTEDLKKRLTNLFVSHFLQS